MARQAYDIQEERIVELDQLDEVDRGRTNFLCPNHGGLGCTAEMRFNKGQQKVYFSSVKKDDHSLDCKFESVDRHRNKFISKVEKSMVLDLTSLNAPIRRKAAKGTSESNRRSKALEIYTWRNDTSPLRFVHEILSKGKLDFEKHSIKFPGGIFGLAKVLVQDFTQAAEGNCIGQSKLYYGTIDEVVANDRVSISERERFTIGLMNAKVEASNTSLAIQIHKDLIDKLYKRFDFLERLNNGRATEQAVRWKVTVIGELGDKSNGSGKIIRLKNEQFIWIEEEVS